MPIFIVDLRGVYPDPIRLQQGPNSTKPGNAVAEARGSKAVRFVRTLAVVAVLTLGVLEGAARASGESPPAAPAEAQTAEVEVEFVKGYASALLEQTHGLRGYTLEFAPPTLDVLFEEAPAMPLDKLVRSLLDLRGVEHVRILQGGQLVAEDSAPDGAAAPSADGTSSTGASGEDAEIRSRYEAFPDNEMFAPLIADPRWPHFSAGYQQYLGDDELSGVGAASFGETFALVRSPDHVWGAFEIGFQAGVFSVFDLDSDSSDLVNSDFLVGLSASHHVGDFTTLLRIYHQSSHLGDEFLLRNPVDRVNLSFEVIDLIVSFDPWQWLRLYGGGGIVVHREPALDRGLVQSGVELTSPRAFVRGYLRPIAALDFQNREESDWDVDISLRAGLQLEHPALDRRRLQLLAEFYEGRSPNGQFYEREIQTVGIGVYLGF